MAYFTYFWANISYFGGDFKGKISTKNVLKII